MEYKQKKKKALHLKVADNNRYLEYEDGSPFFYLGDTAWELFHRLDLEEAKYYLRNRADKGFTVIQAAALAELGGTDVPNANGDLPLLNKDPTTANEDYFRHVDEVVNYAGEIGLIVGMLPTWGSFWKLDGRKTAIFTPENAFLYGRFIGERYRDSAIIWIFGGDQNIENEQERAIIEAMSLGVKEGDGGKNLMTFHPRGPGRSAEFFHKAEWMDFNMCQTSHGARDHDTGIFIDHDYVLEPPKPTIDGEPRYETMPVGFYYREISRLDRFDDYDIRQAAYWALLSGACGHTYGNNNIWQMWTPDREPKIWANIHWRESLDHPGAFQMGYMRRLFESHPFQELIPDQSMILDGPGNGGAKIRAARSGNGSFAFIYSPRGERFTLDKRVFNSLGVEEYWFDPRYGCTYSVHTATNASFQTYEPPTSGRGNDWLLIMDVKKAGIPGF